MKIPVIVVAGPTASGKTQLGVEICKKFGGEVISADSMQIYKGMNIATAKPTLKEMQGIPHHLINIILPEEKFSVADFTFKAGEITKEITQRKKVPVIVGGTGLYIDTFIDNVNLPGNAGDEKIREALNKRAESEGTEALLDELRKIDPECAKNLHINNLKRVVRALEVYYSTGKTVTELNAVSKNNDSPYLPLYFVLDVKDREFLYNRINRRVDSMVESGLVDEASAYMFTGATASQAIGYKELTPYFNNEKTLGECIDKLKQSTRRYAKRQLTWFRKRENVKRIYIDEYKTREEMFSEVFKLCEDFGFKSI